MTKAKKTTDKPLKLNMSFEEAMKKAVDTPLKPHQFKLIYGTDRHNEVIETVTKNNYNYLYWLEEKGVLYIEGRSNQGRINICSHLKLIPFPPRLSKEEVQALKDRMEKDTAYMTSDPDIFE